MKGAEGREGTTAGLWRARAGTGQAEPLRRLRQALRGVPGSPWGAARGLGLQAVPPTPVPWPLHVPSAFEGAFTPAAA